MNIWIWGTGQFAENLIKEFSVENINGFIETERKKESFWGRPVIDAGQIPKDFDYILVASRFSDQIYDWCAEKKKDLSKIIFLIKGKKTNYITLPHELKEILGGKIITEYQVRYDALGDSFVTNDKILYQNLNRRKNFDIHDEYMWPIIRDKYASNGTMGNYFWQDLWAAKKVISSGVKEHYDIGSRVDGFIAHLLAADIKVNVIDIRPFASYVENLHTIVDDATMLSQFEENSIESLSALCSLEHFGLGRYGDPVNPEACFQCFEQICRKLKPKGMLYLSLPVGRERIEFNAHRVFYASTVLENFKSLDLIEFSCTADGKMEYHTKIHQFDEDCHNGEYRYGLFHFTKKG